MLNRSSHPRCNRSLPALSFILSLNIVLTLSLGNPCLAGPDETKPIPFVPDARYDGKVPTPGEFLGFALGTRPVRHHQVEGYFEILARHSDRASLRAYGKTHEGRDLLLFIVSSSENMAQLDSIRKNNEKLGDPRGVKKEELDKLIDSSPVVAWMGYTIHGDEISGTDAAFFLAYHLVASEDNSVHKLLEETVVLIDPLQNPDGRERYLAQMEQVQGRVPNPDVQSLQHRGFWPYGRGNHYLFDLNRDYLGATQPESRGRIAVFARWNPQLVVDAHEMGALDTYLFSPPREPFNAHFPRSLLKWMNLLANEQGRAFDQYGWPYYTREWADNWYPGYTDAFAALSGSIGMLYEQAGVNGSLVKRSDGTLLTYREAVHHQFVSSMANLTTVKNNRRAILSDFVSSRQGGTAGTRMSTIGKPRETPEDDATAYLLLSDSSGRAEKLVNTLILQGLEVQRTTENGEIANLHGALGESHESLSLPAGSYVVSLKQPRGAMARAILGFDPRMTDAYVTQERRGILNGEGSGLYDITSWSLPLLHRVEAYWTTEDLEVKTAPVAKATLPKGRVSGTNASQGYLLPLTGESTYRALLALFDQELRVQASTRPFRVEGETFPRGTLFIPALGNPKNLLDLLVRIAEKENVRFKGTSTGFAERGPDLGGRHFNSLTNPRVALLSGPRVSTTGYGALWHFLDHELGMRVTTLLGNNRGQLDLEKYNTLLIPSARVRSLDDLLGSSGKERLSSWIRRGGTLIAIGNTVSLFANSGSGFGSSRLKRDVLDQLDAYAEDRKRQVEARNPKIDFTDLWTRGPSSASPKEPAEKADAPDKSEGKEKPKKLTDEKRKKEDANQRRFRPGGAIVRATLDTDHWLTIGLTTVLDSIEDPRGLSGRIERIAETSRDIGVMLNTDKALLAKSPVAVPVALAGEKELRLSGLLWPEARTRWAHTAYVTQERVGKGQIILFVDDPVFRGLLDGPRTLLMNALLLGPGLGTQPATSW